MSRSCISRSHFARGLDEWASGSFAGLLSVIWIQNCWNEAERLAFSSELVDQHIFRRALSHRLSGQVALAVVIHFWHFLSVDLF